METLCRLSYWGLSRTRFRAWRRTKSYPDPAPAPHHGPRPLSAPHGKAHQAAERVADRYEALEFTRGQPVAER